jgi:hypothetical protein
MTKSQIREIKTTLNSKKIKTNNFDNILVSEVSIFLQKYMRENNINVLTADNCAELLAENNILSNKVGPKEGFNFRQMLREGRDGKINLVDGAYQVRPKTKWILNKID